VKERPKNLCRKCGSPIPRPETLCVDCRTMPARQSGPTQAPDCQDRPWSVAFTAVTLAGSSTLVVSILVYALNRFLNWGIDTDDYETPGLAGMVVVVVVYAACRALGLHRMPETETLRRWTGRALTVCASASVFGLIAWVYDQEVGPQKERSDGWVPLAVYRDSIQQETGRRDWWNADGANGCANVYGTIFGYESKTDPGWIRVMRRAHVYEWHPDGLWVRERGRKVWLDWETLHGFYYTDGRTVVALEQVLLHDPRPPNRASPYPFPERDLKLACWYIPWLDALETPVAFHNAEQHAKSAETHYDESTVTNR